MYRDIEALRSLGAPLDGQSGIGYCLRQGFFLPEFAFSPDELDALLLGLSWVRSRADPALVQGSDRALSKILSTRNSGLSSSHDVPAVVTAASSSAMVDSPLAAVLRDAIHRQRKIAICYEDAEGSLSHRTIWPIAIVYFDDVRLLAAWCELRSAFRHFRVDRLHVKMIAEERYPGPRRSLVAQWREQDRWPNVQS